MVATMAGLALRLDMYEKSLALADQFLKDFPKSDGLSTMRRMRMAALVQSKRLPDAVKEWETLLKQAKAEQAQEVFQSGMQLAELCADADDLKAARQLYDTIREKIPGLVPEQQRQMASQSIDEAIAPRLALLDMIGKEPAALEGKSLAGEKIDLAKYKGKVVLLDFWATWCKPCVAALPEVKAAYAKYHERGLEVVGVSLDVQKQNLEDFIKAQGIAWPQIWDNEGKEGTPNPFGGPNTRRYNITAIPATYLIDRDGRIVRANVSSDSLDETIRKTLDKPATQPAGAAAGKSAETGKKP
jgi:peroxiredoxin